MGFRLGMHTVAMLKLAAALRLSSLNNISEIFMYVALAAWLITFVEMQKSLIAKAQVKEIR